MQKVLLLGAGLVTRPLVNYLLAQPGIHLTIGTRTVSKAEAMIAGRRNGSTAAVLAAEEPEKLERLVKEHDLSISLLPAPLHPVVAGLCIKHKKHMVTTSYVSPAMKALDGPARDAGIMILNEIGLDPGIDHMSAMRIIHDVKRRGGEVVSFKSFCGGLPAPEANDNPWGYKFSWSPRGVCTAGKNSAKYRMDGKLVEIPGPMLFTDNRHGRKIEGVGMLEAYPNRDSLGYIELYGLEGVETMLRGTYRYPGWCETLKKVVDLGLLDETPTTYPPGTTFAQYTARFLKGKPSGNLRKDVAAQLNLPEKSAVLDRFEWLGLFSNQPIPVTGKQTTPLDILALRMEQRMKYAPRERDMIVLLHDFLATFPGGKKEHITSTLIDFGQPEGDSSMARTVSLPAAVATRLMLKGEVMMPGVHIPVTPEIYNPVLDELETMGIKCVEKTEKL
ncbi:MAG TPA: saccharopine dehydrogenase C-terminal domain-containing protein [Phycisphaerae bacterium]|nr:saccharopine dehydrogenase C-terminal domain-containing protein [Phycisphaerae bacterium]HNU46746.1 saccharopine dehydrogenase C-terminal domain-containing protein [Phycisphaerae bacterium]